MGNSKSTSTKTVQQTGESSRETHARRRLDLEKIQNVLLIWLDGNIDDNNKNCQNTITQLRRVVNDLNTYTDSDQCIQFIETIKDRKACMIISGSLGQQIVSRVHNMSQVDSIFIFCDNKKRYVKWAREWSKIKGVFSKIKSICEALKQAAQQCEQNAVSISFVASGKKLDQLDPSFMYTQILKEILATIKFDDTHIQDYVNYCCKAFADNEKELNHVKLLEKKYHQKTPIWWYSCESFLYPMLNRGIRLMDGDIMTRMGFFINDLHRQIEQLHKEQHIIETFTVYRGQGLSKSDFEQLKQTKGGLISFNNFLSTSKTREISLGFGRKASSNPDLVGILFVMKIDPKQSTAAFASIRDISAIPGEDEVLFSMHSVFRIQDVGQMGENNRLFEVSLTLTSDNDKELNALTERIREESFPDSIEWSRLGLVLWKLGQNDKAEEIYELLLDQETDESNKAPIYHQLGSVKYNRGEYQEAIRYYQNSLAINEKTLSPNHPDLASSYNNIGSVYFSMSDYPEALSYYEKALVIQQQSLPSNHPDLAMSYNNIGLVYNNMGDYPKALSSHEQALVIRHLSLPPNHPDLASSYNNIGLVHYNLGDYSKALSSYEKALVIRQQSLPPNHSDLPISYINIGLVYSKTGDYSKALLSHEKALVIRQQSLPPNHPDLAVSHNNIGMVYYNMREYPKALSAHEKALVIRQQSLPPNHPDLASSYNNIGLVHYNLDDYTKALLSLEKGLAIRQQSLPPNHPDLAMSFNNIGLVYENIKNYSKAYSFYERAIEIGQESLPANHSNLLKRRKNLERVKNKL